MAKVTVVNPTKVEVIADSRRKTATVALARKLLTIAYQMLKEGEDNDPARIGAVG